ncbi:MAG TPA: DegQ family serine endoprotease [Kiloniellales bacterium]|nr:DegQ family serine endoprotease [Kiloniellales bacterium]
MMSRLSFATDRMSAVPTDGRAARGRRSRLAGLGAGLMAGGLLVWSAVATAATPPASFSELAEKVSPAVVYITSTQMAEGPSDEERTLPFPPGSPFERFFREFEDRFGPMQPAPPRRMMGIGSGFIIDPTGYVVTNNHVIQNASEVRVKLSDGREFTAETLGTDPQTDLGLLKIEADADLPYVSFGDSDRMKVGDWVMAVGNPFGLGGTVTAGIISALGRDISAGPYDDFLQTDAAINRGNSGGPMFNLDGEVIGVNTAIFSPNGGSVGIGFAIPSNIAKDVVAQLREHGRVERGWLGVRIQQVTPDLAEALGLDEPMGALVAQVTEDSPAERAGLNQGDVIVGFNGRPVEEMRDLPRMVAAVRAGEEATVEILRKGETRRVDVTIGRLTPEKMAAAGGGGRPVEPGVVKSDRLGATLSSLSDEERRQLGLPEGVEGVVITGLRADGEAARQGLRVGDVITRVDGDKVTSPSALASRIEQAAESDRNAVLLLVNRRGDEIFVGLKLERA